MTKGAARKPLPACIDPLFRSAAVTHGPHVIGVVLTAMLDDGTAGLMAIRKCGGATIVQDPKDAAYPEMPQSALNNLKMITAFRPPKFFAEHVFLCRYGGGEVKRSEARRCRK